MQEKKITEIIHHFMGPNNRGGLGVMATHTEGDSFIVVSTAICSVNDQYTKKIACALLDYNREQGHSILLPISVEKRRKVTHRLLRDFIMTMFG